MRAEKNKKKKVKLNLAKFIPFVIVVLALAVCGAKFLAPETLEGPEIIYAPEEETVELSIRCVGDIMAHAPQVDAAYNGDGTFYEYTGNGSVYYVKTDGSFDFASNFEYVKDYIGDADLALCNVETTFSGDGTYSGYPGFDSPDDLARDIASVGFDVGLFANNHMLDTKLAGAKRTVQVLKDNGLTVVGARSDTNDPRSAVIECKGVKIGLVAYTYETPEVNGKRTLNGSSGTGMNSGAPDYINTFRYTSSGVLDSDKAAIKEQLDWCKTQGAEITICYLHWGNEYQLNPTKNDKALAQFVAENGADIIFASHPHVLQGISEIQVEEEYPAEWSSAVYPQLGETPERTKLQQFKLKLGIIEEPAVPQLDVVARPTTWTKTVPVFYSMGNFVSNQRTESLAEIYGADTARRTEQGMIADVKLTYNKTTGEISYENIGCIPTWVDKYTSKGKTIYKVIPLDENLETNKTLAASGHLSRAKAALTEITGRIGEQYIIGE